MVKVLDSSVEGPWFNSLFASITAHSITASAYQVGAVDDKDLAVSSDQGNTWLLVHLKVSLNIAGMILGCN